MDKQEFFLLIPAIIYGVAIVDILKVFNHRKNYFELVGWGVFLMVAIVLSWIDLYDKLDMVAENKSNFYTLIVQAIIVARIAAVITPEEKDIDTKAYFYSIYKRFFLLMAVSVLVNLLSQHFVYNDQRQEWIRALLIVFMLICAYTDKVWVRASILTIVLLLAGLRVFADVV